MNQPLNHFVEQAQKYARAHRLAVPGWHMSAHDRAKAISDACIHAEAHPNAKYARGLLAADHAFAESLRED